MNKRVVLALAGLFLIVALVAPIIIKAPMIIMVIIEVVLVLLFALTVYFGLVILDSSLSFGFSTLLCSNLSGPATPE